MRAVSLLVLLLLALPLRAADRFDVVVYGGTPGGLIAALAAAREGASVVVVEPTKWIGGMVTGGLANTDVGDENVIGGLTREFFTRAAASQPGTGLRLDPAGAAMDDYGPGRRIGRGASAPGGPAGARN